MASLSLKITTIPRFGQVGATVVKRSSWGSRSFVTMAPRPLQASAQHEASAAYDKAAKSVKKGANEVGNKAEHLKNEAKSGAEEMTEKTKKTANKIPENAQELGEKAKKTAQDAWGAAKDTTQKIKDTVVDKAEQTAEAIKQGANTVKRSVNGKN